MDLTIRLAESAAFWKDLAAVAGPALTAIAIGVGIWQFRSGLAESAQEQARNREHEIQLELNARRWEKQRDVYMSVASVLGRAAAAGPTAAAAEFPKFMELYWGEMVFVEEGEIEEAMVKFRNQYQNFATPTGAEPFEKAAYKLAKKLSAASAKAAEDLWRTKATKATPTSKAPLQDTLSA